MEEYTMIAVTPELYVDKIRSVQIVQEGEGPYSVKVNGFTAFKYYNKSRADKELRKVLKYIEKLGEKTIA